ncbi:MAG: hypothetical protein QXT87_06375 [Thermoproteota archaeon]
MPSSAFETAILTTALYGVMLIVINMFSVVSQWVFIDSVKIRLNEVANQVAYEIADIYSMCVQSRGELSFFKLIEIPVSISEQGYAIELKKTGEIWYVVVYLEANRAINASSPIWEDPGVAVRVGPRPVDGDSFTIIRNHGSYTVYYVKEGEALHSGVSKPVVWACRYVSGGRVEIGVGLGWLVVGG